MLSNLNLSTCSCNGKLPMSIDVQSIFEHLEIDDSIIGMRLNNNIKGDYTIKIKVNKTKSHNHFFNQLTVKVNTCKVINIKVFENSMLQISGIKHLDMAYEAVLKFIEKIKDIKGISIVPAIKVDGLIYNLNDYNNYQDYYNQSKRLTHIKIYGEENEGYYKKIGIKKGDNITINGINMKFITINSETGSYKLLIEDNSKKLIKGVYDNNGEIIGKLNFIFNNKRLKGSINTYYFTYEYTYLPKQGIDDNQIRIYNKYDKCIGTVELVDNKVDFEYFNVLRYTDTNVDIKIRYQAIVQRDNSEVLDFDSFNFTVINMNYTAKLPFKIHKNNLVKIIKEQCNFNYEVVDRKYQVINIYFYFNKENEYLDYKLKLDFHHKVTVRCFMTGGLNFFGFRSPDEATLIQGLLNELFVEHESKINIDKASIITEELLVDNNIDIFDLM